MESFTTPPPPPPRTIKDLPADFMISVVERLSIVDRVRFGSSSSSFNSIFRAQLHLSATSSSSSSSSSIKSTTSPTPPPWMLLPSESTPAAIAFFSISDSRIYRIPQKDSDSDSDSDSCRLFLGSSDGWLVTLDQGGYSQLYLLNPIAGTKIHLPPLPSSKLLSLDSSKAILSWTSSSSSSSYTVVLLLLARQHSSSTRPTALVCTTQEEEGLKAWTPFGRREWYSDAAIGRGNSCRLYTMRSNGTVEAWDLAGGRPSLFTTIVMPKSISTGFASFTKYLVKSKDGLLQVWRSREFAKVEFKVFKLEEEEEWVEVKSLDGQVIFLNSHCSSMSMDCPPELIRANNSIYFDCLSATSSKNRESMVFRMEDGSVESILLHGSIWEPSPIWIVPTLLGTDCSAQ